MLEIKLSHVTCKIFLNTKHEQTLSLNVCEDEILKPSMMREHTNNKETATKHSVRVKQNSQSQGLC